MKSARLDKTLLRFLLYDLLIDFCTYTQRLISQVMIYIDQELIYRTVV